MNEYKSGEPSESEFERELTELCNKHSVMQVFALYRLVSDSTLHLRVISRVCEKAVVEAQKEIREAMEKVSTETSGVAPIEVSAEEQR